MEHDNKCLPNVERFSMSLPIIISVVFMTFDVVHYWGQTHAMWEYVFTISFVTSLFPLSVR